MFKKAIHFIKYNNLTVLILVLIFVAGSGAFAASDAGQEIIGARQVRTEGVDNTLLLEADLETLDMDFKIERIESDDKYYYVTYTYLDIVKSNEAWQYQLQEKTRKITKSNERYEDLGTYLAEELSEQYEARVKDLKEEKEEAVETGETVREEVNEFSGLIGQTLAVAGRVFPGYEPVKTRIIPSPSVPPTILLSRETAISSEMRAGEAVADSLSSAYDDYIAEYDPDGDEVFGLLDNCPATANPEQTDTDEDGIGDECDARPFIKDLQDPDGGNTEEVTIDDSKQTADGSTSTEDVTTEPEETVVTEEELTGEVVEEPPYAEASEGEPESVEVIELPEVVPELPPASPVEE